LDHNYAYDLCIILAVVMKECRLHLWRFFARHSK